MKRQSAGSQGARVQERQGCQRDSLPSSRGTDSSARDAEWVWLHREVNEARKMVWPWVVKVSFMWP